MKRSPAVLLTLAVFALAAAGCHSAKPVVAAVPAKFNQDSANAANAARARAEKARQDSIAAAEAAREAAAREAAARREAAALAAARATVEAKIFFDFDKDELKPEATSTLDAKVPVLQAHADMRIRIQGNADERGSDEYNLALGQRRAATAKRYLVTRGISEGRIDVVSFGRERPLCQEHVESCWQQNRRDEFVITAGGAVASSPQR